MLKVLINIIYFILYRLKKSPSIGEVIADIVYSDRYDDINKIYHHISKIFCMKYKLSHVPKLIIEDMDTCIDGQYDHNTCKIYLNKHNASLDSIMGKTAVCLTILHEYRHHWQYHNLKVIYSDKFHDRFIILDKKVLYHSGASYKDLGNKCFAINKIKDDEYLENILIKIGL